MNADVSIQQPRPRVKPDFGWDGIPVQSVHHPDSPMWEQAIDMARQSIRQFPDDSSAAAQKPGVVARPSTDAHTSRSASANFSGSS